jgi:2-polyprenyl-6-hydroxyphenyl methylase/3-demethylubiquinone-9 3-methyltransferase
MNGFEREVAAGERFRFGKNWARYLTVLDDERILQAEASLKGMLEVDTLAGKSFLDVGSGSGLFSLAARRLGANVVSFDYDPDSVACTQKLQAKYFANDARWTITRGSVLDADFLRSLGQFDIVYAWGVLHHTGRMWQALENVQASVKNGGCLFIMIYRDLGLKSRVWKRVKRTYCSGLLGRLAMTGIFVPYFCLRDLVESLVRFKNPAASYREYKKRRGMSKYHDWVDWLGGYPYEYAKPSEVIGTCNQRGLDLIKNVGPEYVFRRNQPE